MVQITKKQVTHSEHGAFVAVSLLCPAGNPALVAVLVVEVELFLMYR